MARKKTLFFKPKSKELSKVVSITSPAAARTSIAQLKSLFRQAKTRSRKIKIARAAMLAGNRALASTKRVRLSPKEKKEMLEVGNIFIRTSKSMFKSL